MADEKKESQWGALEIVLVLVLTIGLLSNLRGAAPSLFPPERKTIAEPVTSTKALQPKKDCGIKLTRPKPQETVGSFLPVQGFVSGCGWQSNNSVAAYVQIVDVLGMPMSAYTPIPVATTYNNQDTFSSSIVISGTPAPGIGYALFFPAYTDPENKTVPTVRIPIRFK